MRQGNPDIDGAVAPDAVRDVVMYLVLIAMPSGKAVAQGAHAALGAVDASRAMGRGDVLDAWGGMQTKIALRAKSGDALVGLHAAFRARDIPCCLVRDAGLTVFKEPTITALAVGPVSRGDVPELRRLQIYRRDRPDLGLGPGLAALVAAAYRDLPEIAARRILAYAEEGGGTESDVEARRVEAIAALVGQLQAERAGA